MNERIPEAERREMREREEAATEGPLGVFHGEQIRTADGVMPVARVSREPQRMEIKGNAEFFANSRTDLPRLLDGIDDAYAELDKKDLALVRAKKALEDESRDARKVFEELQRVSKQRDGADDRYRLADHVAQELALETKTQADEMKWYRSLKIVRQEEGITEIDGGRKAQMLHEMWEENVRLKAELEKRPGLSREETADLFGGKMMNVAQQGVELLARAKQIDTQAARIKALEERR